MKMARALFRSWFVDFDPVRAKAEGRPSGLPPDLDALFPASFEASELGEIPAGWEVKTLGDVIDVNPRRRIRRGDVATHVAMAALPTSGPHVAEWTQRAFTSGARFTLGDTLLARITPSLENGKTALVDFLDGGETAWGSTEFIVLRPKPTWPPEIGVRDGAGAGLPRTCDREHDRDKRAPARTGGGGIGLPRRDGTGTASPWPSATLSGRGSSAQRVSIASPTPLPSSAMRCCRNWCRVSCGWRRAWRDEVAEQSVDAIWPGFPATEILVADGRRIRRLQSERADGTYAITMDAERYLTGFDDHAKARLTTWLLDQRAQGDDCPLISGEVIDYASAKRPLSVDERAERLLRYLGAQSDALGAHLTVSRTPVLAWTESTDVREVSYLADYLDDCGLITGRTIGGPENLTATVTIDGHRQIAGPGR